MHQCIFLKSRDPVNILVQIEPANEKLLDIKNLVMPKGGLCANAFEQFLAL